MKHQIFTEKELESVFCGKKRKTERSKILNILKTFSIFVSVTIVIFVAFNYQELYSNFGYWYRTNYQKTDESAAKTDPSQEILNIIAQDAKNNQTNNQKSLPPLPQINDNSMVIPSISVTTPITWTVPNTPTETLANLKNGVIHIQGTALPGEKGNVFVSGHSSNYPWVKSDYNSIFSLLNKLVIGDVVHLKYSEKDYIYRVSEIKIVKPDDSSVMQSTNGSILTLMTCAPVGTNLKRLIVITSQIYPNPNTNISTSANNNLTMPKKMR